MLLMAARPSSIMISIILVTIASIIVVIKIMSVSNNHGRVAVIATEDTPPLRTAKALVSAAVVDKHSLQKQESNTRLWSRAGLSGGL